MTILNQPNDGWIYEFTVVKIISVEKDIYEFVANYDNIFDDRIYPPEEGYLVLHDVRVRHKKKKEV